jgi:alkylation response protein AidB-like acyl-CoA dehydrogenase
MSTKTREDHATASLPLELPPPIPESEMVIRRNDYSLSPEEQETRSLFRDFFKKEVSGERVRSNEPVGFDRRLWRAVADLGAVAMGLPEDRGGSGSSLVDLTLVAEEYGRVLAPVPLVEAITAVRLLSRVDGGASLIPDASAGSKIVTFAPVESRSGGRQLIPAGAVADAVIGLDKGELVLVTAGAPHAHVPNQGAAPLAWWDLGGTDGARTVLATGRRARELYSGSQLEWKLLSAAALVGLADGALSLGVEYAKVRHAFGQPIGTFQAVSHSLVDSAIGIEGARHLNWKAAWYFEHEPAAEPTLVPMAFAYAAQAATKAVGAGLHVHGGVGFMEETDITLYFRRAKTWTVIGGDPKAELDAIADHLFARP